MFIKILSAFLSVLFSIFPFFQRSRPISNEAVAKTVIAAVENRDAASLESVLCSSVKQEYIDKNDEIKEFVPSTQNGGTVNEFLDCIEGDVTEIIWKKAGGYFESDGNGKSVQQNFQGYYITTTTNQYFIAVTLETYNSFNSAEMGIRQICVAEFAFTSTSGEIEDKVFGEILYDISATEGCGTLHD